MILTLLSMTAAVACYAIKELAVHGNLKWDKASEGFWGPGSWGRGSWIRKYNKDVDPAPYTWYYRFFKIKYKERFPLSATLLVAFTDGMHLAQAGFKMFLALSFYPWVGWIWAGVIWVTFGLSFTIFYKLLSR